MANEFVARNGIISKGDLTVSGSIITTSPISLTGNLNVDGNIFLTGSRTIQTVTGSTATKGPTLTLLGGNGGTSSGAGGDILLKGGNGINPSNVGGDVYIYGGDRTGSQRSGNIYIGAQSGQYQTYLQGSPIFTWDGPNATTAITLRRGGSNRFSIYDDVNLTGNYFFRGGANTINAIWDTWNSVIVRGKGTTSATTAFQVQNSGGTTTFLTRDDGISVAYGQQLWVGKSDVGEIAFSNEASTFDKRFSIRFQTSVMYIQGTLGGDKGNMSIARDTSQVGFGRGIPVSSAQVQIDSTTRGFLLPRTDLTSNITSSAQGLMTYITASATEGLYYYNSGSYQGWTRMLNSTGSQAISGSLTVVGTSNLGGATFSNGGATFANNVNVAALNEGSGNSWVNLNTTRVHLGQNGSTGGLNVTAATQFVGVGKMATAQLDILGNTFLTGSLAISSSAGTGSAIYAYKSGSTVLDIQGSQGQLFSVVDALSGSLMSVNDVSGLPILEVFSDDRVVMGTYGAPALVVTGSNTIISGSLRGRVVTLSTASATASMDCSLSNFFDLTLSGSMYLNVSNIQPGETINLRITQPATSGSLNYTSSIKFPNGLPYSASATSSVVDLISFISFDSSTLYATSLKNLV